MRRGTTQSRGSGRSRGVSEAARSLLPREVSRGDFLRFGGLGSLSLGGLWLNQQMAAAGVEEGGGPGARSRGTGLAPLRACIFVFYYGGPSHLDTYDLKPGAPSTIRGEFQPISTTVPGLQISEHLPKMAQVMHHCALIRSMHHKNRLHDSASIETHTGRQASQGDREEFAPIEQFFPCHGSTISYVRRTLGLAVPHAALPFMFHNVVDVPCQGGGFLGQDFDPFRIAVDGHAASYAAPELSLRGELPVRRMQERLQLRAALQPGVSGLPLDRYFEKASELLSAGVVQSALDLSGEQLELRERYGLYAASNGGGTAAALGESRHMRGQNLLVARRLVEAGVPFVNVFDFRQQGQNWDSHAQNFQQHREYLLPPADRALAALITDLAERGLLDSTLVVATGEFGRTPQINATAGRDHWPDCYSVLLAGGGVQGGAIYGASDAHGAFPARDPVTPADLAATIFWRFGLDPSGHVPDRTARPWKLAEGEPIRALFGAEVA